MVLIHHLWMIFSHIMKKGKNSSSRLHAQQKWVKGLFVFLDQLCGTLPKIVKESPSLNIFKDRIKSWIPDNCKCRLCNDHNNDCSCHICKWTPWLPCGLAVHVANEFDVWCWSSFLSFFYLLGFKCDAFDEFYRYKCLIVWSPGGMRVVSYLYI